ncbi:potassium voltage-gated channel subfamily V member 1 isoform X2 [Gadus macrocephalus]|uniref:potassium voltage-gated channel subfamily V member 1 isoform X2 n=1 Tax=Gadus macrocephalus TaxID=80720 RepID=UPI0028CB3F84|nr:potassium voltage-gated channel subfamily V member 1 isoform X2 [Gadus macrocephalus]
MSLSSLPSLPSLDSSGVFHSDGADSWADGPPPEPLGGGLVVNVGGCRYQVSRDLLAPHPDTRLGRLARSGPASTLDLCDDADLPRNEFFFDRSSQTFQEDLCAVSFLQEIQYWGIEEVLIGPCCRERYLRRKGQKESLGPQQVVRAAAAAEEDPGDDEDFTGAAFPGLRRRLWDFLEKPDSSRAARTFGSLSVFFVVASVVNMALISLEPAEGAAMAPGGGEDAVRLLLDVLEYACVVWFTAELALRFLCVRDKWRFSRGVANVIDLLAILPFYVTLAVERLQGGTSELENVGRVVQVLRLMRSLRMLKLGRHSTGLRSLASTITECYEEVGLLLLFLGVGISLFATTIYALEHHLPGTTFSSVPMAWWWATTSMTTVGYGDIRPDSAPGKVVAFMCILAGILILALPIAIINDRFSACYFTLRMKEVALRHRQALRRLASGEEGEGEVVGAGGGGGGVNLRDAYARSLREMMRLEGREQERGGAGRGVELRWWRGEGLGGGGGALLGEGVGL